MAKREKSIRCPECGGRAAFETRTDTVEYKGQTAPVKPSRSTSQGLNR